MLVVSPSACKEKCQSGKIATVPSSEFSCGSNVCGERSALLSVSNSSCPPLLSSAAAAAGQRRRQPLVVVGELASAPPLPQPPATHAHPAHASIRPAEEPGEVRGLLPTQCRHACRLCKEPSELFWFCFFVFPTFFLIQKKRKTARNTQVSIFNGHTDKHLGPDTNDQCLAGPCTSLIFSFH